METLELKLLNAVECLSKAPALKFDGERWTAPIDFLSTLEQHQIPNEEYGDEVVIQLKTYALPAKINYYPILNSDLKVDDVQSDIVVFDSGPTFILYSAADQSFRIFGAENQKCLADVTELISYFRLLSHLKSTHFCDYYNAANNEIVIYNSSKGIQKIVFDTIPNIKVLGAINSKVKLLLEYASQLQFKLFLQNAAFAFGDASGRISLQDLIKHAEDIVAITQRDFQLVNKKFNFESFQDSLIKEKNKYFNSIRDVLGKVASQSVGIPISIGATVFTSYKVTGDISLNALILFTFMLYVAFYIKIQLLYKRDVKEILREFVRDFDIIKAKSGLPAGIIQAEHTVIVERIAKIDSLIFWLIFMIVSLAIIVVTFLVGQMTFHGAGTIEPPLPRLI